jgi:hypothetical protein
VCEFVSLELALRFYIEQIAGSTIEWMHERIIEATISSDVDHSDGVASEKLIINARR